jgi:uncharacterized protein DUF4332
MVLVSALALLALATAGLFALVEPVLTWYYHLAWWSYIVAADALNRRLAGRSLLRDQPRRFLWLALGSVAWWTLFEALNLRLGNWYYVMDPPSRALRWTGGVLAFATVLPGILETVQLGENLGWLRSVRVTPLRWGPAKDKAVLALGAASFGLPLAWPEVFFPLTWGSFVFLLEPWNRRHARRSFLRDLEQGEAGPFCRTLLAGLVCGLLWETWNYWARTKWIYTVPGFERLKVFEMPLLGFLGFPPFAVQCLVAIRFVQALASGARARGRLATLARTAALAGGAACTLLVFRAADAVTVDSFYTPVARLATLPPAARERLAGLGLDSPEKLLRALDTADGRDDWSARSGLSIVDLERVRARVELVMHRGLGQKRALQLQRLGIDTRADLRRWDPQVLAGALRAQGASPRDRFLARRVRVWVEEGGLPGDDGHSLSNGLGGRPVGSAAARRRASSNFFSRMSFWLRVCCTERANFSSRTSRREWTRLTSSSKSWAGSFFLSTQTTAPVSGSTFISALQQGQVTSSASGMERLSARRAGPASGAGGPHIMRGVAPLSTARRSP